MRETTVGQVLVNAVLPEDLRDYDRELTKKETSKLILEVSRRHPDEIKDVLSQLTKIGYRGAYLTGGQSFGLKDMSVAPISKRMQKELSAEIQNILRTAYRSGKKSTDPSVTKAILAATERWRKPVDDELDKEDPDNNPLFRQHKGTQASKPGTYRSIRAGDLIYVDQNNKPIPVPVTRPYTQGLTPVQYFAGAFGARKGSVDLQKATQDAGYLCLDENTEVRMADFTVKCIKDINVGDYVLGVDDNQKAIPVQVTNVFNNGLRECYKTVLKSKNNTLTLISTKQHKVLCETLHNRKIQKIEIGTEQEISCINLEVETGSITKCYRVSQEYIGELPTYDIEVNSDNHLFVLANGLIVSNSKQLVQIAHRLVVVDDDDYETPFDESNPVGYPTTVDDPDNEGGFLAMPVAGYKRNTMLTPKILADMKKQGVKNIIVRSVIAGGPGNGGVYAYDAGIRERGALPVAGDFIGINAVQGISEPITQAAISCLQPDTIVMMADGTRKPIKYLKIGDRILGSDKKGNITPTTVVNIFNNGVQGIYATVYSSEDNKRHITLLSTLEHKVLQVRDKEFEEIPIGTKADTISCVRVDFTERGKLQQWKRTEQEYLGTDRVMDIEVDHPDHLFVLGNGMIVSNSKHSGGVAGASSGKAISGFNYINQLIQVPKHFPGGATHSTLDGKITGIANAPQGGKYIFVDGTKHYVRPDNCDGIKVKVGDTVEAGDVMTAGTPNPAEIVKYKGIGEGRRYFVDIFRDALANAGSSSHRRNIEALSRGLINYVKCTDEMGDYAPEDILPYCMVAADWQPRAGFSQDTPAHSKGRYLEKPVLHYTIGTRITPSVINKLNDYGIKTITTHKDPPPFEPEMIRGMGHVAEDPDWGTRMLGAYNKNSILEGARRGSISNVNGTSYVPAIAFGDMEFGHHGATAQTKIEI